MTALNSSHLSLLCQNSPILIDRLSYSDWLIGTPDTFDPLVIPIPDTEHAAHDVSYHAWNSPSD